MKKSVDVGGVTMVIEDKYSKQKEEELKKVSINKNGTSMNNFNGVSSVPTPIVRNKTNNNQVESNPCKLGEVKQWNH